MRGSPEERERLLRRLDAMERATVSVYRILLGVLAGAVLGIVVFVALRREPGSGSQGEYWYFGIAVLLALGWLSARFAALKKRTRALERAPQRPRVEDSGIVPLEDGAGWQRSWQMTFGGDPPPDDPTATPGFTFTRRFGAPLASLPADVMPDDAALDAIARGLARGEDLDDLCRAVQPAYGEWNRLAQRAYRMLVEARLNERGAG